jgi:outer membrane lipoprotein-sorting protein
MMRNITVWTSLLLLVASAVGFIHPQDKADDILKQSKTEMESLQDFGSDFVYQLAGPGLNGTISKRGSLKYKQGKYVVNMAEEAFYCDMESLWIYLQEDNTVNILEYDPEEGMNIEAIFELYEASADPRYDGVEKVNGEACHKIFLAIKDPSLDYNQATLWINQKTNYPAKATLINRKQTRTTFELNQFKPNVGYSAATFQFDPKEHPGVVVYDER